MWEALTSLFLIVMVIAGAIWAFISIAAVVACIWFIWCCYKWVTD